MSALRSTWACKLLHQIPMRHLVQIKAQIDWMYTHDQQTGSWIAICPPLKLTVEAESKPALDESISESMDMLFNELLSTNDLDRFLAEHGWSAEDALPSSRDEEVCFDVPLNTRRVSAHDLQAIAC